MDGRGAGGSIGETGASENGRWPTGARTTPADYMGGGGRALAVGTAKHDMGGFGDEVTKFICLAAISFMAPKNTLSTRRADGTIDMSRKKRRRPPPPPRASPW